MSHHLNRMERAGLVTRRRYPQNRRVHLVELTPEGEAMFFSLLQTVIAFDQRLRAGFGDDETMVLSGMLARLRDNVSHECSAARPFNTRGQR